MPILAAASLLICLASIGLWIRGHFADDRISRAQQHAEIQPPGTSTKTRDGYFVYRGENAVLVISGRETTVDNAYGQIVLYDNSYKDFYWPVLGAAPPDTVSYERHKIPCKPLTVQLPRSLGPAGKTAFEHHLFGFSIAYFDSGEGFSTRWERIVWVGVPWAAIVLLTGLPPAIWLPLDRRRQRRAMRVARNLCLTCGYALKGNRSGVCPECGTSITTERSDTQQ